jgi:hypothetical protein
LYSGSCCNLLAALDWMTLAARGGREPARNAGA